MPRLEDTQSSLRETSNRGDNLSQQASNLLNERNSIQKSSGREQVIGALSFDTDLYGSAVRLGDCKADGACSWQPDANSRSKQTEQWKEQREAQRNKPLSLDEQDRYEVKRGDTMNDIARRYFKDKGIEPSNKDVDRLGKMIAEANKDNYAILKCNPNLLRPGMKLEMPPAEKLERPSGLLSGSGTVRPESHSSPAEGDFANQGSCGRYDNLPGNFQNPSDIMREIGRTGTPWKVEFRDLLYRPSEDKGVRSMQIPFNPKDKAGIFMQVPFKLDDASLPNVIFV
ncbi:MAG: LysM peptidoglycan-binding domain-containing protein [Candidatus Obscuribacterales bacterium]|nr:LysM peptidoglycan-binding domain-containing protein [Candidatus Obscuribacterales bacterium]